MHARSRRHIEWPALLAAISLAAAVLLRPGVANAATITVTTAVDDTNVACTLRDAIAAANLDSMQGACAAGSGDDIINITATGTINLDSQLPAITTNMTIDGPGASLLDVHRQGGGDYRIFSVGASAVATISDLTVSNGLLTGIGQAGAGIGNFGTSTLDRVTVTGNSVVNISDSVNPAPGGGGIANLGGTMTLRRSTVSGNTVTSGQTAASGQTSADATGGGIYNTGTLTVERSTISGNTVSASVTSTAPDASAFAAGGGVRTFGGSAAIRLSTVSGNQATATATSPAVTTTRGGGIFSFFGPLTATSDTIAFNSAEESANLSAQSTETVTNTIISNPQGGPNCDGSVDTDGGFNLEFPAGCAGLAGAIHLDPQLQTLADNGGPTQTHGLPSTSPALDGGTSASDATDQRELTRPVDFPSIANAGGGDGGDIGSFELQTLPPLDTTIDTGPSGPTKRYPAHLHVPFESRRDGLRVLARSGGAELRRLLRPGEPYTRIPSSR